MLRNLKVGEKVLVIDATGSSRAPVGTMLTCTRLPLNPDSSMGFDSKEHKDISIRRIRVLAIGDKVVRGPDWSKGYSGTGDFVGVGSVTEIRDGYVNTYDSKGHSWSPRITADHQDLKHAGESEEVGEDKLKGYEKFDLTVEVIIDDKQEEAMNREQRAVKKDEEVEGIEKAITDAKIAHKEDMAAKKEQIAGLKEEARELRDSITDKEALVKLVMKAKNLGGKVTPEDQAGAILALKDKEIEL